MTEIMGSDPKAYVDRDGVFLGQFADGAPPADGFEVPVAPEDGSQVWNKVRQQWSAAPEPLVQVDDGEVSLEALRASNLLTDGQIDNARATVLARKRA